PETLRAIADKATAPDPAQRFADASDMLAELDAFMVGERAAAKGEAPARLLVGWLGEVWQEQRDEAGTSGELDEVGDHLVSFLDDGELDIVGTGTARSMLATAAEPEPAPTPSPTPAEPPKAAPGPAAPVKNAPTWWVPVAVVAVAGAVIAVFATEADTRPPPAPAVTPAIATTPPPKPPPAPQPKAPPVTEEVRPTPPPAPPPHAAPKAVVAKTRHVATPPPVDHPAAPAQQTFSLMVNTSPWSNFTIDGDPTKHTTIETVQLPAGPHRFHFWNEAAGMQRDVTIDVPAPDGKWVGSLTTSP
ncbi:MAG TPA: hypothetical protein VLX92_00500, partial [Kofleriaceae bacterium]|nr:hypothetical protein [Kofleriaceae bacterium]